MKIKNKFFNRLFLNKMSNTRRKQIISIKLLIVEQFNKNKYFKCCRFFNKYSVNNDFNYRFIKLKCSTRFYFYQIYAIYVIFKIKM